jgi:hypothetical protein
MEMIQLSFRNFGDGVKPPAELPSKYLLRFLGGNGRLPVAAAVPMIGPDGRSR